MHQQLPFLSSGCLAQIADNTIGYHQASLTIEGVIYNPLGYYHLGWSHIESMHMGGGLCGVCK